MLNDKKTDEAIIRCNDASKKVPDVYDEQLGNLLIALPTTKIVFCFPIFDSRR
jgi:hypothetical protein